jgi:hypothetical protein
MTSQASFNRTVLSEIAKDGLKWLEVQPICARNELMNSSSLSRAPAGASTPSSEITLISLIMVSGKTPPSA